MRLGALLCAVGCAHARGAGEGVQDWRYTVTPTPDLARLDVEVCFARAIPPTLVADEDGAGEYLLSVRAGDRTLTVDAGAGTIDTSGATGKCVAYAVDLARMTDEVVERHMVRVGGVVATSPHLWLWRPAKLYAEAGVTLQFRLPDKMAASVPWPRLPDGSHRLTSTAFTWASQVVLGNFHAARFTAAGSEFDVAVMDLPREISDAGLRRWLTAAADTVAGLYGGRFPVPHMQVIVVPYPGGGDPVYFGMALRGGGPAVQLLISSEAADDEFPGEWVAIHEFLHHGMPFVDHQDAWLSEGFVTYYTEVLRARAGWHDQAAAWRGLLAGFARGRRSGAGQSLADESREMHEHGAYQRVYWGGAAIALLADVALREAGSSLDAAMRRLQRCCAGTLRIWPAQEVLRTLDEQLASSQEDRQGDPSRSGEVSRARPSLTALAGPILRSADFPDLSSIYRKLGVSMVDGVLTLDESAPIAHVRRAIFAKPPL